MDRIEKPQSPVELWLTLGDCQLRVKLVLAHFGKYFLRFNFRSLSGGVASIHERHQWIVQNRLKRFILSRAPLVCSVSIGEKDGLQARVTVGTIATVLLPLVQLPMMMDAVHFNDVLVFPSVEGEGRLMFPGLRGVPKANFFGRHFDASNAVLPHMHVLFPSLKDCRFWRGPIGDVSRPVVLSVPESCNVAFKSGIRGVGMTLPCYTSLAALRKLCLHLDRKTTVTEVVDLLRVLLVRQEDQHALMDITLTLLFFKSTERSFIDVDPTVEERTQAGYDAILHALPGNFAISSFRILFEDRDDEQDERNLRRRVHSSEGNERSFAGRWKKMTHHIDQRALFNNAGLRPTMTEVERTEVLGMLSNSCDATWSLFTAHGFHRLL